MRDHHRGHISKPTRRLALAVALVAALVLPGTAAAKPFVPKGLLELAGVHPKQTIQVIVVAAPGTSTGTLKNELLKDEKGNQFGAVRREFEVVPALVVEMQAKHLPRLATRHGILSITPDGQVREQAAWAPLELWPLAVRADALWPTGSTSPRPPAIAVVDSGIHDGLADFGDRVVARENVTSFTSGDAGGDSFGHGTLVAGIAAGGSPSYPGVAPTARLISVRAVDGEGRSRASDVIAAAEWIMKNRISKGIGVANYSIRTTHPNFGIYDTINMAV